MRVQNHHSRRRQERATRNGRPAHLSVVRDIRGRHSTGGSVMAASKPVNLDGWWWHLNDSPDNHPGRMLGLKGYEAHCPFCLAELREDWKNAAPAKCGQGHELTPGQVARILMLEAADRIRRIVEVNAEVWPDEVEAEGDAAGRAFAYLMRLGEVMPSDEWRPSRKKGSNFRHIRKWVRADPEPLAIAVFVADAVEAAVKPLLRGEKWVRLIEEEAEDDGEEEGKG